MRSFPKRHRALVAAATLLLTCLCAGTRGTSASTRPQASPQPPRGRRELTLEDRLTSQRAIEEVYWNHRIWPEVNPLPKPSFDEVVDASVLRAKVEDSLKMSNALEAFWSRPIGADQLQAEMARMARDSREPAMLLELFSALGNDPERIAECLARPVLAERLLRAWYSTDDRFHAELRGRVEAILARGHAVEDLKRMGGKYSESRWKAGEVVGRGFTMEPDGILLRTLDPEAMDSALERLRRIFAADMAHDGMRSMSSDQSAEGMHVPRREALSPAQGTGLPVGRVSSLQEGENAFFVTAVLAIEAGTVRTASVTWPKTSFDSWWSVTKPSLPAVLTRAAVPIEGYAHVLVPSTTCTNDSWQQTRFSPALRGAQTAVWTGSEMIVWGGLIDGSGGQASDVGGGRYNPATDTWTPVSVGTNAAIGGRYNHTAVWTGTEMIVWGGAFEAFDSGGRYNPSTDTWLPTSRGANVPSPRERHTAVWTGSEMIVWGGSLARPG